MDRFESPVLAADFLDDEMGGSFDDDGGGAGVRFVADDSGPAPRAPELPLNFVGDAKALRRVAERAVLSGLSWADW